jgi:Uma2 family endonuclease
MTGSLTREEDAMPMLILEPTVQAAIEAKRAAEGLDAHDEVWEGMKIIMPLPNIEHQRLAQGFGFVFQSIFGWPSPHEVLPGANLSDRVADWNHNFRAPDVLVYLQGNSALNCDTHWVGGPDLLVEILSPNDRARDKLPFYASVNTREVLIVDRDPWQLELYHLQNGVMVPVGIGNLSQPAALPSSVLPVSFRLIAGAARPQIEIRQTATGQGWAV